MLDLALHETISRIHTVGRKIVLEFAGAGSQALYWLHAVPGSSRTVLEATDRYASESLSELLGGPPEQSVARSTARAMAERAYRRAMHLTDGSEPCVGIGCTAALVTNRERRGANRCWIAWRERERVQIYGLTLHKGLRDRIGEEEMVSRLIIHAIATGCGLDIPQLVLTADDQLEQDSESTTDLIANLQDQQLSHLLVAANGTQTPSATLQGAILSGAFNPLHAGHERLAQATAIALKQPVTFELPIWNADKPPLGYREIEKRLNQFRGRYPVVLSREPLFVEKAKLYPGCVFVVGFDTAARLIEPRYYGGEAERDAAFASIRAAGCRFLVAGRVQGSIFRTLQDMTIPETCRDLFSALPERAFRVDISSSEIRAAVAAGLVNGR
jgi:hypothetical protein